MTLNKISIALYILGVDEYIGIKIKAVHCF